jgi:cyclic pyranopterin phosphate synthase
MVNVGGKDQTVRRAVARGRVLMAAETARAVAEHSLAKGDVLAVARIAGIQAAKRTSEAIPLCHPLMLSAVEVECTVVDGAVEIEARVEVVDRTGVEMEALHACSVAALTVYDMCKSIDKDMVISDIALWEKTGGRSGTYRRA